MERIILRQSAILLARTIGFIESADLLSGVVISTPDIARRVAEKYAFKKFPQTIEEFDLAKGIEFLEGELEKPAFPIKKFLIWSTGITVETRISTNASQLIMEDILQWGAKEFGINYSPGSIKRYAYVSDVTFFSDAPLLAANPAVSALAARASEEISRIWKEPIKYEPLGVRVGHDPLTRKNGIANFSIDHRAETPFSEGKYFSEAPIPTHVHWEMLEQYEKDILLQSGKAGQL